MNFLHRLAKLINPSMGLQRLPYAAKILGLTTILGTSLVVFSYHMMKNQIRLNENSTLLRSLNALIPPEQHDNDLLSDSREVRSESLLGIDETVRIYRARKQGKPVAAIFTTVAPDGYNGKIRLLVAIDFTGNILGVRVIAHQETPRLGDYIEIRHSPWIFSFNGRSLQNLSGEGWRVKRDGGVFDQFSGATITPRAVVKAVYRTLLFYQQYQGEVFL